MKELKDIKWCAIQPLTGGMYLGTEKAIGHPAEFILSYPGVGDVTLDKEGNIKNCGNEYHLMKYLDKVGRRPEYKVFNRQMFQNDDDMDPEILNSANWTLDENSKLNYTDMDLVVAVPVCAGLSTASTSSLERKQECNCNMIWISKYALRKIQPKIYIFENAPTFITERGAYIRVELEKLAEETGYVIDYYKTDTKLHDNCQQRRRNFIIFYKKDYAPKMEFEHLPRTLGEYLARIPEDKRYKEDDFPMASINGVAYLVMECFKDLYGKEYRNVVKKKALTFIDNNLDDLENWGHKKEEEWKDDNTKLKMLKSYMHFIDHYRYKKSLGRGVYQPLPIFMSNDEPIPAVMFKMMQSAVHPDEDRFFNSQELLHFMGHPIDFELQGIKTTEWRKIGQNVPVRTAYWIVSEALRAYDRENDLDEKVKIRFFDNQAQKEIKYIPQQQ